MAPILKVAQFTCNPKSTYSGVACCLTVKVHEDSIELTDAVIMEVPNPTADRDPSPVILATASSEDDHCISDATKFPYLSFGNATRCVDSPSFTVSLLSLNSTSAIILDGV